MHSDGARIDKLLRRKVDRLIEPVDRLMTRRVAFNVQVFSSCFILFDAVVLAHFIFILRRLD